MTPSRTAKGLQSILLFYYRYFVKVAQEALCLDWAVLLGVLLLDEAVVRQAVQWAGEKMELLTVGGVAKVVQEMEDLSSWASQEWYVYCTVYMHNRRSCTKMQLYLRWGRVSFQAIVIVSL